MTNVEICASARPGCRPDAFVGTSRAAVARRIHCFDCVGAEYDRADCAGYAAAVDSNGYAYCAHCGHRGEIHPVLVRRRARS